MGLGHSNELLEMGDIQCVGLGHSNELLEMGTVCGIRAQQ